MPPLFKKLNVGGNETILVVNAPESYEMVANATDGDFGGGETPDRALNANR